MTRLPLLAIFSAFVVAPLTPAAAQSLLWTRQAGTAGSDSGVPAVDSTGNVYIAGYTQGNLGGPNAGNYDYFIAKYDASGVLLWTRQAGTPASDYGGGVAVDGAGNAYISGSTEGSLGGPNAGVSDVFLAKYDSSGALLWTRQIGTPTYDYGGSVAVDGAGNVYISGLTQGSLGGPSAGFGDVFLAKYDASGTLLWTRQFGTPQVEESGRVAVNDAGDSYITGLTQGSLGGPSAGASDIFLAKYDTSGALLWTRQFGTPGGEYSGGVAVDGASNAYITGYTWGSLGGPNAGFSDVFLAKYDPSGALLWTRQTGTSTHEESNGVAVDGAGNAFITGPTAGSLGGPNAGQRDTFLAKYDASGTPLWTRQTGTTTYDGSYGVAADGAGNAYIAGYTEGNLGGPNAGQYDYFLAKYGPPACYPNCDNSTSPPVLNTNDFQCFLNQFAASDPAANCDHSTNPPTLNVNDFQCFLNRFAAGCS